MAIAVSLLYNVVVLPRTAFEAGGQLFQLSATRQDRSRRLISPDWTETEVRAGLFRMGATETQVHELIRGNRMSWGGRDVRRLWFTDEQLEGIGLAEPELAGSVLAEPEPVEDQG